MNELPPIPAVVQLDVATVVQQIEVEHEAVSLLVKPKPKPAPELPHLDGETGYCAMTNDGTLIQLWPTDGSYFRKPGYYVHYAILHDDGSATCEYTAKPLSVEGVQWFFSDGPGARFEIDWWRWNPEPVFEFGIEREVDKHIGIELRRAAQ